MTASSEPAEPPDAELEEEAFYDAAVSQAERVDLAAAAKVEGLDQEIAILRLRLRQTLADHPENMTLMLKGVELLVKALAANYRLSKKSKNQLSQRIRTLLEEFEPMTRLEAESDPAANN